ncbi:phosphotyrosine protein phosphatases II [Gloeophyllum trabeum ATCC 11539]|uniref:protein-tyrosine-phosphatase n=1 Tax=Gloeophyllum trabeum (strain ATCC 11539 / FP-39264 / Madison 617) TaxID=670483 RepID=S7RSJ1_GLOTA|nr:phosphotyrosine protein phosphatases II [Gloeophyllum trabeum ATCC 11539]EPQ57630.1 phosphotyrosine protein phosphatases II [Gloeophyllum trabeum ATCC 11539]
MYLAVVTTVAAIVPIQDQPIEQKYPPEADKPLSMRRSVTLDDDYFERRELRLICTQKIALDDFLPQENEIIPRLYLCDLYTATCPKVHDRLGITHVLSAVRRPWFSFPPPVQHLNVPIEDTGSANLLAYLDAAVAWLHRSLCSSTSARVMVHCVWGMSRSASIVVAYLIVKYHMTLDNALAWVRLKRTVVRPNHGFMAQLEIFEMQTRERERRKAFARARSEKRMLVEESAHVQHIETASLPT